MVGSPPSNVFATVSTSSREGLRARILECYRECNPGKYRSGEASKLIAKYRGQEALLLRRIQHKYSLVVLEGTAWTLREGRWEQVELRLTASDGYLRSLRGKFEPIDAKMCVVEMSNSATGKHGLVVASVGVSRNFRFASPAERDAWALELRKTRAFFEKVNEEQQIRAENERNHHLALQASVETAQADKKKRVKAEQDLATEIARAAALSQLHDYDSSQSPPPSADDGQAHRRTKKDSSAQKKIKTPDGLDIAALCASLEADVDEALVCTAQANDLTAKNDPAAAFEAYLASVAAFVNVKVTVAKLPPEHRPEPHVLKLVDRGTRDCKNAAATLLAKASPRQPDPPHTDTVAVPAAINKIIVDADDL